MPPLYLPSHAGPDNETLRPCGCHADPAVFGHDRLWCTSPQAGGDSDA